MLYNPDLSRKTPDPFESSSKELGELLETLDASIFSGEALYTDLEMLNSYVSRWKRAIEEQKLTLDNEEEIV